MKCTLLVFLFFLITCKNDNDGQDIPVIYTQSTLLDSFMLGSVKVRLTEYRDTIEYSTMLVGRTDEKICFKFKLDAPLADLQLINLINDSIPEIVIYECIGCEHNPIRIFTFDSRDQLFVRVEGMEELNVDEVFTFNGTDMVFTSACFNQGGCESKLFKIKSDSAFIVASMWMPYEGDTVVIESEKSAPEKYVLSKADQEMYPDSLFQKIWTIRMAGK